jgi:hypothetical protein
MFPAEMGIAMALILFHQYLAFSGAMNVSIDGLMWMVGSDALLNHACLWFYRSKTGWRWWWRYSSVPKVKLNAVSLASVAPSKVNCVE